MPLYNKHRYPNNNLWTRFVLSEVDPIAWTVFSDFKLESSTVVFIKQPFLSLARYLNILSLAFDIQVIDEACLDYNPSSIHQYSL